MLGVMLYTLTTGFFLIGLAVCLAFAQGHLVVRLPWRFDRQFEDAKYRALHGATMRCGCNHHRCYHKADGPCQHGSCGCARYIPRNEPEMPNEVSWVVPPPALPAASQREINQIPLHAEVVDRDGRTYRNPFQEFGH